MIAASIDWESILALREIQGPDEPDIVQEVIDTFLADGRKSVERIQTACANDDRVDLANAAHRLRSSALLLGAGRLVPAAAALEHAAAAATGTSFAPLLGELEQSFDAVVIELRAGAPM